MNAHTPVLTPLALEHADLVRALHARDFATKAELCERLGRDPSNLNKTLKRLAAEGLVDFDATTLTPAGANAVRDLDALAGMGASATFAAAGFVELSPFEIANDPLNPRKHFDEGAIGELADSIARDGLLENLVVRELQAGDTVHRLVAGERRWRAMCKLIADGRWDADQRVACKVIAIDDAGHRRIALVENLQRKDLRPIDEATALKELMAVTGVGTAEVAKEIGFTQRFVQQRLQLLDLPAPKQEALQKGEISIEAARNWLAARPATLELTPEQQLVLLEVAWEIAKKPNTQWTSAACDYTAPRDLEKAELLKFYADYYTGKHTVLLASKAFGHLRAISGADDSLTRALLEPLLRKARVNAVGGNPLAPDHDPEAFKKVDELFRSKRHLTPWLNSPKPDPKVAATRAKEQADHQRSMARGRADDERRKAEEAELRETGRQVLLRADAVAVAISEIPPAAAHADLVAVLAEATDPTPWRVDPFGAVISATGEEIFPGRHWGEPNPRMLATRLLLVAAVNHTAGVAFTAGFEADLDDEDDDEVDDQEDDEALEDDEAAQ